MTFYHLTWHFNAMAGCMVLLFVNMLTEGRAETAMAVQEIHEPETVLNSPQQCLPITYKNFSGEKQI